MPIPSAVASIRTSTSREGWAYCRYAYTITPRVYLAGLDVFRSDVVAHFQTLTDTCEEFGMEALAPFEAACHPGTSQQIFETNMRMLRRADGMIASLDETRCF